MTLAIVGLGPGGPEHRTAAAERAVRQADVVIGYGPYVDQCADLLDGQEVVRGRMGEELARAQEAIARARAGAREGLGLLDVETVLTPGARVPRVGSRRPYG